MGIACQRETIMLKKNGKTLHILWTNDNLLTSQSMVFMYATNSLLKGWWEDVHLIVWGATAKLLAESEAVLQKLKAFQEAGGSVSACKRCAEELGVLDKLEALDGIEILYIGSQFTEIINSDDPLITI